MFKNQGINEKLQEAMKDYFAGTITEEKAWENFKKTWVMIKENT